MENKTVYIEVSFVELLSRICFLITIPMIFISFKGLVLSVIGFNLISESNYYLKEYKRNEITFKNLMIKEIILFIILLMMFVLILFFMPNFNIFDVPKLFDK